MYIQLWAAVPSLNAPKICVDTFGAIHAGLVLTEKPEKQILDPQFCYESEVGVMIS
jgi:hypothetical protein